jgi:branched-chain amino acid transport system permease protein
MIILALIIVLGFLPLIVNDYWLSVFTLALYYAYVGKSWNLMAGFSGQISLGYAVHVGIGSYVSALLFIKYGVSPILVAPLIFMINFVIGAILSILSFRFAIEGVYFSLLTISFSEITRLIFEHWKLFGANSGLFLPVYYKSSILNLSLSPIGFYYCFLFLAVAICLFSYFLIHKTNFGYRCLAIRENQKAAQSLGVDLLKTKTMIIATSSGLASIGGILYGFYSGILFPDQVFAISRSMEIIIAPIVGGLGTIWGAMIGSLILVPLGEVIATTLSNVNFDPSGLKHIIYGCFVIIIIMFMPKGIYHYFEKKKLNK